MHPEGIFVNADFNRMTQVMTNLINNGIKYGKEGGWVEIGFSEQGETVEVSVKDNGVGIPPEHVDRVFERFYRVDKSRSKKQGGTGLGLAIVKHILEGHNTRATINSVVDVGTTFSFKIQRGRVIE
jgi:two-component system phosphate regulon sensor histidine kinase PhoR